ncbi:Tubulin/FtsZ [Boletus coccyginus]|nr:Tubulin/FtsZ [Boletus coccyginus]
MVTGQAKMMFWNFQILVPWHQEPGTQKHSANMLQGYQTSPELQFTTIAHICKELECPGSLSNQMVKCDPREGKYMACMLLYCDNIMPKDINTMAISIIKICQTIQSVDRCSTRFKPATNKPPTLIVILSRYPTVLSKHAFVHWYIVEGMPVKEGEFSEAYKDLAVLKRRL